MLYLLPQTEELREFSTQTSRTKYNKDNTKKQKSKSKVFFLLSYESS